MEDSKLEETPQRPHKRPITPPNKYEIPPPTAPRRIRRRASNTALWTNSLPNPHGPNFYPFIDWYVLS